MKLKRMFAAAKKDSTLELLCYDIIGGYDGISAKAVSAQIAQAGEFSSVLVRINSPGGDAFEGIAIKNILSGLGKPVKVMVDGIAASAASILAMAGDEIEMGDGAMLMIHNAWTFAAGNAAEMRKTADTLDRVSASITQVYATRTGLPVDEIKTMMDEETWLEAADAVGKGFATSVTALDEESKASAQALSRSFNLEAFANVPERIKSSATPAPAPAPPATPKPSNLSLYEARLRALRAKNAA